MSSSTRTMRSEIQLGGCTLSNTTGTAQYGLAHKMELHSKERLCINVGEQMFALRHRARLRRRLRLVGQGRVAHDSSLQPQCLQQTLKLCLLFVCHTARPLLTAEPRVTVRSTCM